MFRFVSGAATFERMDIGDAHRPSDLFKFDLVAGLAAQSAGRYRDDPAGRVIAVVCYPVSTVRARLWADYKTISARPVSPLWMKVLSPITLTTRRACASGKHVP